LTHLGYESIAGWSPDGKQLYYAIPASTSDGFLLKKVNVTTGEASDMFVLKDSSRKAPMPAVSPDGNWIAYRGADNASLYLIRMDGAAGRKLIEPPSPNYAITGIAWGPGRGLLGVSLMTPEVPDGQVILLQPDGCEAYILPALQGELDGLLIP
jgi:Tol biopolymer transport system component